jgi:hypothetical protein
METYGEITKCEPQPGSTPQEAKYIKGMYFFCKSKIAAQFKIKEAKGVLVQEIQFAVQVKEDTDIGGLMDAADEAFSHFVAEQGVCKWCDSQLEIYKITGKIVRLMRDNKEVYLDLRQLAPGEAKGLYLNYEQHLTVMSECPCGTGEKGVCAPAVVEFSNQLKKGGLSPQSVRVGSANDARELLKKAGWGGYKTIEDRFNQP